MFVGLLNQAFYPFAHEKSFADIISNGQYIIKNGGHINAEGGYIEFEEILKIMCLELVVNYKNSMVIKALITPK